MAVVEYLHPNWAVGIKGHIGGFSEGADFQVMPHFMFGLGWTDGGMEKSRVRFFGGMVVQIIGFPRMEAEKPDIGALAKQDGSHKG